jgi:Bacterial SH3 domain
VKAAAFAFFALTALAVSPASAAPADTGAGKQRCNGITFYSADENPAGLDIRSGPGANYPVLGKTHWQHLFMTAFKVLDSRNGWFKVQAISEWDYGLQKHVPLKGYGGVGWVSAKNLLVEYYAGETFFLHRNPGSRSGRQILVELEISGPQRLLECKGSWVRIEHLEIIEISEDGADKVESVKGWINGSCDPKKHCPFVPTGGPWITPPWQDQKTAPHHD